MNGPLLVEKSYNNSANIEHFESKSWAKMRVFII